MFEIEMVVACRKVGRSRSYSLEVRPEHMETSLSGNVLIVARFLQPARILLLLVESSRKDVMHLSFSKFLIEWGFSPACSLQKLFLSS